VPNGNPRRILNLAASPLLNGQSLGPARLANPSDRARYTTPARTFGRCLIPDAYAGLIRTAVNPTGRVDI